MSDRYRNPTKNALRTTVLSESVAALTSGRDATAVHQPEEVSAVIKYSLAALGDTGCARLGEKTWREYAQWCELHESRTSHKRACDLKVVYLCGPEPLNDFEVLVTLGINPHNIWAIESDRESFNRAREQISNANIPLKIHFGSIDEFFRIAIEQFDIAYIDGTRPLLSTGPRTLNPVIEILRSGRLNSLSVLITNFSAPPEAQSARYAAVMTDYFRFRYNDLPEIFGKMNLDPAVGEHDPTSYSKAIEEALGECYSDFITRLVSDLGRWWLPSMRALSSGAILRTFSQPEDKRGSVIEKAAGPTTVYAASLEEALGQLGDMQLSPSSYPLRSFLHAMMSRNREEPLIQQIMELHAVRNRVPELTDVASCLDRISEGHWDLASEDLIRALKTQWFDSSDPYTCDLPLPNLLINSLLGIYGYPHFRSATGSKRYSYTSNTNEMFLDVFAFDRCRSFFDWFPTVSQVPSRFESFAFQIVARSLIDRLNATDANSDTHPFRGGAVAGFYELDEAPFHFLQERLKA